MNSADTASPRCEDAHDFFEPEETDEKLNRHWRGKFLSALAETSNVSAAAAVAGVPVFRAYKTRRTEPGFAREWNDALCEGYENLEMELLERLRFGEAKADADRRFDNGTATRQLGLHRETVTRLRAQRDNDDAGAIRRSIDAKLAQLRARIEARLAASADGEAADAGC